MQKIFLIFILISHHFYSNCISDEEKEFLHELLNNNPKLEELGWAKDSDISQWKGVVIRDCSIISFDLSGFYLKELPNSIFYLNNLEILKVNKLSRNVFSLPKLRVLHLRGVDIKKSVDLFSRLKSLKELKISDVYFKEFPEQILKLKELERLDFSNNSIETISKDIIQLQKLKYLSLRNNKYLQADISSLQSLSQLEHLDLSNTKMFGEYVCSSPHLKYLNLSNVELFNLNISKTNKLEVLKLKGCNLNAVLGIENQKALKSLNINNNYIHSINVKELIKLDSIDIGKNEFSRVPLFSKQKIAYLNVSSNPIFSFSEGDYKVLQKVKTLDLSYMSIDEIQSLSNCESLNLSNNFLKKISFNSQGRLKYLDISANKLKEFSFISDNLNSLNLIDNEFDEIPLSIFECKNLQSFFINNFELKKVPKELIKLEKLQELYLPFYENYDDVLCELKNRGVVLKMYVDCE